MDPHPIPTVLVTGAAGRVGSLLRAAWARQPPQRFRPVWHGRRAAGPDWHAWDMLSGPCPALDPAPAAILHLAGPTPRTPDRLDETGALARAAFGAARGFGCRRLLIASSAAVYGPARDVSERRATAPVSSYGHAKAAMEREALAWRGLPVTLLRIANVPGADGLLAASRPGRMVTLDPVDGGRASRGPLRSWIGPVTLAATLDGLLSRAVAGRSLPAILNLAQSPALPMAALLDAAGIAWRFGPPNRDTIAGVSLSTRRLSRLVPALGPADPAALVAEWRHLA